MRIERDGRKEQYTYADLRELATRVAGFLASEGIKQGDRVMLVSSNAPEWGMTLLRRAESRRHLYSLRSGKLDQRDSQFRARRKCRGNDL